MGAISRTLGGVTNRKAPARVAVAPAVVTVTTAAPARCGGVNAMIPVGVTSEMPAA